MIGHRRVAALCVLLTLSLPGIAFAQRELHWERIEVDARLDAAGRLVVVETQKIVFTGDWNGGERRFNILRRRWRRLVIGTGDQKIRSFMISKKEGS
jgi:hypothetical protein